MHVHVRDRKIFSLDKTGTGILQEVHARKKFYNLHEEIAFSREIILTRLYATKGKFYKSVH